MYAVINIPHPLWQQNEQQPKQTIGPWNDETEYPAAIPPSKKIQRIKFPKAHSWKKLKNWINFPNGLTGRNPCENH